MVRLRSGDRESHVKTTDRMPRSINGSSGYILAVEGMFDLVVEKTRTSSGTAPLKPDGWIGVANCGWFARAFGDRPHSPGVTSG